MNGGADGIEPTASSMPWTDVLKTSIPLGLLKPSEISAFFVLSSFSVIARLHFLWRLGGDLRGIFSVMKLTKRSVDALFPRRKQYIEYDTELKGFGVAIYPSGVKNDGSEYRPHRGGLGTAKSE